MTLVLSYDDTNALGRIKLEFSGYSVNADYALVERSLDQITWITVRGGDTVALTAGVGLLYDYEYQAGVINYYRVSSVDLGPITPGTQGTASNAVNASNTPGLPAGLVKGDVMILQSSIRNSGTGTVNVPSGWTVITNVGNMLLAYRQWVSGDTAPTVTFSGGAANQDTMSRIFKLYNAGVPYNTATPLLNGSAQDVTTPPINYQNGDYTLRYGWKQDDSSGMALTSWTLVCDNSSTAGDDASSAVLGVLRTTSGTGGTTVITWSGGAAAISRGGSVSFGRAPWIDRDTGNITPTMATWRLKNPSRPGTNTTIVVTNIPEVTRRARTGTFDVLGRTLPVAVTDVQSSREFTLEIDVSGFSAKEDMDNRLATGEPMFLQAPTVTDPVPTLYFVTGNVSVREDTKLSQSYTFVIPVIEVAKPGSTVYGDTYVWQDVVNSYATWTDVLAAVTTWSNLIDKVSTGSVIVP